MDNGGRLAPMGLLRRLLSSQPESGVAEPIATTTYERVPVVGESHYQPALRSICGAAEGEEVRYDCFAELVLEPDNPHDPNAVMVQIEGQCVGYLSRSNAVRYREMIQTMVDAGQPATCTAFVGCAPDTGNPNLGVSLEVAVSHTPSRLDLRQLQPSL